ncbi:MAG: hypothetical protein E7057_02215 [Lentisphaerae bacterium]|nr:hypothetical protein [Lentisphaerota bacterium]
MADGISFTVERVRVSSTILVATAGVGAGAGATAGATAGVGAGAGATAGILGAAAIAGLSLTVKRVRVSSTGASPT